MFAFIKEKIHSLKWKMIAVYLLCWAMPVILMFGVLGNYISNGHMETMANNLKEQLSFNQQVCVERLNSAVADSRQASYDGVIKSAYNDYVLGTKGYTTLYSIANQYLTSTYYGEEKYESVMLWFAQDPLHMNCAIYNSKSGGSYQQVQDFWDTDFTAVKEVADTLETAVSLYEQDGHVYVVRNLVNSSFQVIATLVMCLNTEYCFASLASMTWDCDITIYADQCCLMISGEQQQLADYGISLRDTGSGYIRDNDALWVYSSSRASDFPISVLMRVDANGIFDPFYGYQYTLIGMGVSLLPLLGILIGIFRKNISMPIDELLKGTKRIADGELGHQIVYEPANVEFAHLTHAINKMSGTLQYQFNHIYEEEIALRDARIMALQSHINPHFMNNTLEIINWEARMAGNDKVSQMIEALSVLLDAAMDREKRPEVSLAQEMENVDAYIYIITERFMGKVAIHKEIAPETLSCRVPRLILQPIIENAVEHGVIPQTYGNIVVRSYMQEDFLILEVENDGIMTEEDKKHVEKLLSPDYDSSKERSGSLGIANVNQRLRILYGAPCGLEIRQNHENRVRSRMMIAQFTQTSGSKVR